METDSKKKKRDGVAVSLVMDFYWGSSKALYASPGMMVPS